MAGSTLYDNKLQMHDFFKKHLPALGTRPVLLLAPMEGITSIGIRDLYCKTAGMDILATEFIRITGKRQRIHPFPRPKIPLQIQLMGNSAEDIAACIDFSKKKKVLFEEDWLDLNAGCPSKRVNSNGAGAALLKTPELLKDIILAMRSVHSGPLSLKTRLAYQDKSDFPLLLSLIQELPIDFITINARLGSDHPDQLADLEHLNTAVRNLPFPVVGNGNIWNTDDAFGMLEKTGVHGLMCGRGAISNPFVFDDIKRKLTKSNSNSIKEDSKIRIQQLYSFITELLNEFKQQEEGCKKQNSRTGAFKEFAFWLSKNPLIGEEYFSAIKTKSSLSDIRAITEDFLKR